MKNYAAAGRCLEARRGSKNIDMTSQCFLLKRFEGNDADIQRYTGLSSYPVLICLYRDLEPLLCYLRLCHSDIKSTSTQIFKPRARVLQPIDEVFLALVRLQLGLLEQHLAHRFNIHCYSMPYLCNLAQVSEPAT